MQLSRIFAFALASILFLGSATFAASEPDVPARVRELALRLQDEKTADAALQEVDQLPQAEKDAFGLLIFAQDSRVSVGAKRAMTHMAGAPGESVSGLAVSAVQVAPVPHERQCATVWVVLSNTTDKPMYVLQAGWRAFLKEVDDKTSVAGSLNAIVLSRSQWLLLKPGESSGVLLDMDCSSQIWEQESVCVELQVPEPQPVWHPEIAEEVEDPVVLHSRALTLRKVKTPEITEGEALLARVIEPEGVDEAAFDALMERDDCAGILREGLRSNNEMSRQIVAELFWECPTPIDPEALLRTYIRRGPRTDAGENEIEYLFGLQETDRAAYYRAMRLVARECPYRISNCVEEMNSLFESTSPDAQAVAAQGVLILLERGSVLSDGVVMTLAWLLHTTDDPALRDTNRARDLLTEPAKTNSRVMPRFMLASIEGDEAYLNTLPETLDMQRANSIAWRIALAPRAEARDRLLALKLSKKAVRLSVSADANLQAAYLDTLAAVYAACVNDFAKAAEAQRQALNTRESDLPWTDENDFSRRLVRYIGLQYELPEKRPEAVFADHRFVSDMTRGAWLKLARDENETGSVRISAYHALQHSFASHESVRALADIQGPWVESQEGAQSPDNDESIW